MAQSAKPATKQTETPKWQKPNLTHLGYFIKELPYISHQRIASHTSWKNHLTYLMKELPHIPHRWKCQAGPSPARSGNWQRVERGSVRSNCHTAFHTGCAWTSLACIHAQLGAENTSENHKLLSVVSWPGVEPRGKKNSFSVCVQLPLLLKYC